MQKESLEDNFSQQLTYNSLIDQVILVGLDQHCRIRFDSHQLRWITSLGIINKRQYELQLEQRPEVQEGEHRKYVEIGNSLILKLYFCQKSQKPITKLKSCLRTSANQDQLVSYPNGIAHDEYIYFERAERTEGKIIIQDLEMVEITGDRDLEIPEENNYEVIRLPTPCQTIPEENSSNEQLIEKTRYLLIKTLDLDDHDTISQFFEPSVTFRHLFKNSKIFIDYDTFHDFCFPEGVPLLKDILGSGYQIINFILTQEDNTRLYINCLKFREKLPKRVIETLPSNCVDKHLHEFSFLFAEQAFCIVSRFCYTDFFHTLLEEVFRKYLTLQNTQVIKSRNETKSQGCICPSEEVVFIQLVFEFIRNYEKGLEEAEKALNEIEFMKDSIKIEMEWYEQCFTFPLPIEDAANLFSPRAVHCLFSVLSVEKIAEVFLSLMLEKKIFFVSDSQIVLGYVIESLLSFLYPLKWEHVILPILPEKLLQLLDAPVPLIAGIPTSLASDDLICSAKDTTVVFLDCNEVISKDCSFQTKEVNHLKQALKKLRAYEIYSRDRVFQMLLLKEQFFLFKVHEKEYENIFSAEHIKHIFFEAMLLFLQNYNFFYSKREGSSPGKISLSQQPRKEFNFKKDYQIEGFINSHPRSLQRFMRKFTESTHFTNFIYKYVDSTKNTHKHFIDNALSNQRLNKSPVKLPHVRFSEQPFKSNGQVDSLKKKTSLQNPHNTTWSPPPKKSEEISTNYSRNDRFSLKLEDADFEKERSIVKEEELKKTKGGQICEAITKAMTRATFTKRNVMIWTQARVARLKKVFGGKHEKQGKEGKEEECGEEKMEGCERKESKQL